MELKFITFIESKQNILWCKQAVKKYWFAYKMSVEKQG